MADGHTQAPRQARDVMAFGAEVGRVLSDGRIVGRAEAFAKVFASSRVVKRAVGLAAWGVLEDIALDARLDDRGRLLAETNVRRIAANLGLNKNTVTRHLRALRDYGFVLQEEARDGSSGQYATCRYVLDPSACLERFTHTPAHDEPLPAAPVTPPPDFDDPVEPVDTANVQVSPCPKNADTVPAAVSQEAGHRRAGHRKCGQPYRDVDVEKNINIRAPAREPTATDPDDGDGRDGVHGRLTGLGVVERVAADVAARYPAERITAVLEVAAEVAPSKPAGWVIAALRDGWDLDRILADHRAATSAARRADEQTAALATQQAADAEATARGDGWATAISAALDDDQLATAIERVTAPIAGFGRRLPALCRAQLLAWAIPLHRRAPDRPLDDVLARALPTATVAPPLASDLPPPPARASPAGDLSARIAACLAAHETAPPAPPPVREREGSLL